MKKHLTFLGIFILVLTVSTSGGWGTGDAWGAHRTEATATVLEHLRADFNLSHDQVTLIHQANLSVSDSTMVLAVAEQMPGRITDANIQSVLTLRQGTQTSWNNIAGQLNVAIDPVLIRARTVLSDMPAVVTVVRGTKFRNELKTEFKLTDAQVALLQSSGLGRGQQVLVVALAERMPGGLTDANIQAVLTLRQSSPGMGWGDIAAQLNVKLGPAVSRVRHILNDARHGHRADDDGVRMNKRVERAEEKAERRTERLENRGDHGHRD